MPGPRDILLLATIDVLTHRLKCLARYSQNLSDDSLSTLLREVERLNSTTCHLARLDGIALTPEPHTVSDPNTQEAKAYSKQYWEKRNAHLFQYLKEPIPKPE